MQGLKLPLTMTVALLTLTNQITTKLNDLFWILKRMCGIFQMKSGLTDVTRKLVVITWCPTEHEHKNVNTDTFLHIR